MGVVVFVASPECSWTTVCLYLGHIDRSSGCGSRGGNLTAYTDSDDCDLGLVILCHVIINLGQTVDRFGLQFWANFDWGPCDLVWLVADFTFVGTLSFVRNLEGIEAKLFILRDVFARNYAGTGAADVEAPKQPPPPLLHLLILSLSFSDRLSFGRRCFFISATTTLFLPPLLHQVLYAKPSPTPRLKILPSMPPPSCRRRSQV
ncbi:hypothetical protein LXL04_016128 [Taraxacum kok-saghyz]